MSPCLKAVFVKGLGAYLSGSVFAYVGMTLVEKLKSPSEGLGGMTQIENISEHQRVSLKV